MSTSQCHMPNSVQWDEGIFFSREKVHSKTVGGDQLSSETALLLY